MTNNNINNCEITNQDNNINVKKLSNQNLTKKTNFQDIISREKKTVKFVRQKQTKITSNQISQLKRYLHLKQVLSFFAKTVCLLSSRRKKTVNIYIIKLCYTIFEATIKLFLFDMKKSIGILFSRCILALT